MLMQIKLFTAQKTLEIALKYKKWQDLKRRQKRVKIAAKNNNTSSQMLLVHCYAFGLLL